MQCCYIIPIIQTFHVTIKSLLFDHVFDDWYVARRTTIIHIHPACRPYRQWNLTITSHIYIYFYSHERPSIDTIIVLQRFNSLQAFNLSIVSFEMIKTVFFIDCRLQWISTGFMAHCIAAFGSLTNKSSIYSHLNKNPYSYIRSDVLNPSADPW
jgi:hypothetical protein